MKQFTSKNQKIGEYGEQICAKWLSNNGYSLVERNYTMTRGEIDIIAKKDRVMYFIEVKSIMCENTEDINGNFIYNPAENMTSSKIRKCHKAKQEYMYKHNVSCETRLDLYLIYIDRRNIKHKIEIIKNIF